MSRAHQAALALAVAVLATACRRSTLVGSLTCARDTDCAPPDFVCGPDGRCVPGCLSDPDSCVGGSSCDPASGECVGGNGLGTPCAADSNCDPPDLVCRVTTQTCVIGCAQGEACAPGFTCNPATGHCCDSTDPSCPRPPPLDAGVGCNTDSECVGAPANICSGGACVPGCTAGAKCTAPLACNAATGHCSPPSCARDTDCDNGSYCTQAGSCVVLAFGGAIRCAGGTPVSYTCAMKGSPSEFAACAGAPGPAGCPYCIEYSCLQPGLCGNDSQCHAGNACTAGLCRVKPAECPTVASIADVIAGVYAAGKELCVRAPITRVRSGYDGFIEVELGTSPYLFAEVPPMYQAAGVTIPAVGQTATVHGTVRWDYVHYDRELVPVDWFGP
jgi:hypothetical protein